jgi:hypothetical protein
VQQLIEQTPTLNNDQFASPGLFGESVAMKILGAIRVRITGRLGFFEGWELVAEGSAMAVYGSLSAVTASDKTPRGHDKTVPRGYTVGGLVGIYAAPHADI